MIEIEEGIHRMNATVLGVCLHFIGGLAAGSFYVPFAGIRRWSWETYWLIFNLVAYLVMPGIVAWYVVPAAFALLAQTPWQTMTALYGLGVAWGIGGLAFGLTLRYLGMGLGMSMSLGVCTAVGTLIPPLWKHEAGRLLASVSGGTVLAGVAVCLAGIAVCGYAGARKEREVGHEEKAAGVKEFALTKGMIMALVAGLISAAMSFAIDIASEPVGKAAVSQFQVPDVYKIIPALLPIMAGNFTSNFVLCLVLNVKNRSLGDYVRRPSRRLLGNYFFAALAGVIGYQEFFWYSMGTTKLGAYSFSSWSIHLAFVIIVSNLWGVALGEWKGIRRFTWLFVWGGIALLLLCTIVIGAGNYLEALGNPTASP